jgi:hypothetical protein
MDCLLRMLTYLLFLCTTYKVYGLWMHSQLYWFDLSTEVRFSMIYFTSYIVKIQTKPCLDS